MAASIDCQTPVPSSAAAADPSANALLSGLSATAARVLLPLWYSPIICAIQSSPAKRASARAALKAESQQRAYKLLQLISTNLELLNLWKLLAEHQFYLVARKTSAHTFVNAVSRLLLAKNRLLLNRLIACLLEHYLADSASEACSSLYTPQDALCAKANEMLQAAAGEPLDYRRTSLLAEAGRLYREAAPPLADVLPRLEALQAYEDYGRIVPGLGQADRALHFTREGRKPHTRRRTQTRSPADTAATRPCWTFAPVCVVQPPELALQPCRCRDAPTSRRKSALLSGSRGSSSWQPPLSRNRRPKRSRVSTRWPECWTMLSGLRELLCRHLKRCGKVLEAARIYSKPGRGSLRHDPADLAAASGLTWLRPLSTPRVGRAKALANCFNSWRTSLDTAHGASGRARGAASSGIAVGCLALRWPKLCAGSNELLAVGGAPGPALVNQLWEELLDRELAGPAGFRAVQQTLARLGRSYSSGANGEDFFPAVQIVATLEKRAIEARLEEGWVVNAFCQFDYPLHRLAQAYDQLLRRRAGDPVWQSLRGYHQLLRSLICLLAKFQRAADSMPARNRYTGMSHYQILFNARASQFLDMISSYQVDLRSHTDAMSVNISQRLAQIRDDLARMA
uniref:Gamma-tubulin complex component n=1 Tax=Macrostomum lignano TaxID=282301 RepID=A0A1I8JR63_9PLAT